MKLKSFVLAFCVGLTSGAFAAEGGQEHHGNHQSHQAKPVTIEAAWARSTASMARNGAAYMTIINHSNKTDVLLGLSTPVATKAELHGHFMEDGMMSMRQLMQKEFGSHTHTTLKPGDMHIMLMGLKEPVQEGASFPVTLSFQNAGDIVVNVVVKGIAAMGPEAETNDDRGARIHQTTHEHGDHGGMNMSMSQSAVAGEEVDRVIDVTIAGRKVTLDKNTVRVTQGQKIQLRWVTDESTEIHVHGYDVKTSIVPGVTSTTTIDAHAAGRFPITSHGFGGHGHGGETTLLYLEVYPG